MADIDVFEGEYVTKRDGGIKYRFVGSWKLAPNLKWRVKVWRGGDPVGDIDGTLVGGTPLDVRTVLLGYIRKSIEYKLGVQ